MDSDDGTPAIDTDTVGSHDRLPSVAWQVWINLGQRLPMPSPEGGADPCYDLWRNSIFAPEEAGAERHLSQVIASNRLDCLGSHLSQVL